MKKLADTNNNRVSAGLLILCLGLASLATAAEFPSSEEVRAQDWFLAHLYDNQAYLSHMRIDSSGWNVVADDDVSGFGDRTAEDTVELVIPVFPSVYRPDQDDKIYYDAILDSAIATGDKVLVIGAGSGSDAWMAWLKTRSRVYVIEINPMAVANIYATAQIAGFEVQQLLADFRTAALPREFSGFDWVLWNMPYLEPGNLRADLYHDGDDGSVLRHFLATLPQLLVDGGRALVLNDIAAFEFMNKESTSVISQFEDYAVFEISND